MSQSDGPDKFERACVFEAQMNDLVKAEAAALALDTALGGESLDSIYKLSAKGRLAIGEALFSKAGKAGTAMITLALLEYALESKLIAYCPDDRCIWGVEGEWEVNLPESRDNCG